MIKSKKDLFYYLEQDKIALRYKEHNKPRFFNDEIWKFQILLRKNEYLSHTKVGLFKQIYKFELNFYFIECL